MAGFAFRPLAFLLILLLNLAPAAAAERVAVLLTGAGGAVPIDFLVRNRAAFTAAGWRTVVAADATSAHAALVAARRAGAKVAAVAMSRGAVNLAEALAAGGEADAAVFVSGVLQQAMQRLGSPRALPSRVLVVHNPRDACPMTAPADARRFVAWAGGRAELRWIDVAGPADPQPCGPRGAHGYFMRDGAAVAAVTGFLGRL
jgi:hypothetical protein